MEEINRHFSSFHGYRPPRYSEDLWDQVSMDDSSCPALQDDLRVQADRTDTEGDALISPPSAPAPTAAATHQLVTPAGSFLQNPTPYCAALPEACAPAAPVPVPDVPAAQWPWPGIMSLPGTDYSVMGHPSQPAAPSSIPPAAAAVTRPPAQDFYTCVHLMNDSGEVHLVPCLAPAPTPSTADPPPPHLMEEPDGGDKEEKRQQLAEYVARKMEKTVIGRAGSADGGKAEQSDVAVPLLPVAIDNRV